MTKKATFLAVDLGASGGRVIASEWDGQQFQQHVLGRFANQPKLENGQLFWDVATLWAEIQAGLARYKEFYSQPPISIGVDSWGVDYGLLDSSGQLLQSPHHYRDNRTDGLMQRVGEQLGRAEIFSTTGIQFLPFNTLYQLVSEREQGKLLEQARTLLLIPDLFHYWLSGAKVAEYTNATTTQFFNLRQNRWATELLGSLKLELASNLLPPVVNPGTHLANLLPQLAEKLGLASSTKIIAPASHDTASAVAAVPGLDEKSVYLSSGTWSLMGIELATPITSPEALALNFTNEGGVNNSYRLLKNIGGLWLLQECERYWRSQAQNYSWPELLAQAEKAQPFASLVDPDHADFLNPLNMPTAIQDYCRRTGQAIPTETGQFVRCCLESLALKYRWTLAAIERLTGKTFQTIRIVGGGSQNSLLCQLTAQACQREVIAGPVEATATGNILVQAISSGYLSNISEGRQALAASTARQSYYPGNQAEQERFEVAFERFQQLLHLS